MWKDEKIPSSAHFFFNLSKIRVGRVRYTKNKIFVA